MLFMNNLTNEFWGICLEACLPNRVKAVYKANWAELQIYLIMNLK